MSSSSFSASMSMSSSSSDENSPSSPSPPSLLAARSHLHASASSAPPVATPAAASVGSGASTRLQPRREAHGRELLTSPLLRGSSSMSSSFLLAGSTPEKAILIEDEEIPRLDDVIHQAECVPDPVYLARLMRTQEHVCVGSQPSVFCITHRR